ncbi:MarR family winged helix-turn-helix transcriptional regulator [Aeromicrobium sp. CTD01-1L150]|uniref:MarR family winged helix-turn-helix transcriptional regulator n=1 Tax=Aeromicrobium sp. CTD01-1L150 TaxID=3341830 RepID=UPI0035C12B4E
MTRHPDEQEIGGQVDRIVSDWRRERPELMSLRPMAIFGRLSRIGARQRTIFNSRHEAAGLSLGSFDVLANLRRSGPPHEKTPGDLAESSMLSSGGITLRLDRMEADGLIDRTRSEHDRRVVHASLSARGREVIDAVYGQHVAAQAALLADLTEEELEDLERLLRKVEVSIEKNADRARDLPVTDGSLEEQP